MLQVKKKKAAQNSKRKREVIDLAASPSPEQREREKVAQPQEWKENECVVCFEDVEDVHFTQFCTCRHSCVCEDCFVDMRLSLFSQEKLLVIQCPLCNQKNPYVVTKLERVNVSPKFDQMLQFSGEMFAYVKQYLSVANPVAFRHKVARSTIASFYQQKFASEQKVSMISVDQCEVLLQIAINRKFYAYNKKNCRLRRVLVALCAHPWNVDVRLGNDGLCYHGNGGNIPTLAVAIDVIYNNHSFFMGFQNRFNIRY